MRRGLKPGVRKHTRFKPEGQILATIQTSSPLASPFGQPTGIPALVFSEAYGGCGLVLLETTSLQVGETCVIRLGHLSPMRGKIVWRNDLDGDAIKLGVQYLE